MGLFSSSSSTNKSGGKDLSHGRFLGPLHPDERKLEQDPSVTTTRRRVFVDASGRGTGEGAEVSMCAFDLESLPSSCRDGPACNRDHRFPGRRTFR